MSTTLPSQMLETMASAAGSGLDSASHLVSDATESLGDIAGAAIDIGGSAAGVIADSTVRSARKAWSVTPDAIDAVRRHPVLAVSGAVALVTVFVLVRQRRRSGSDAFDDLEHQAPRGVSAVDAA